MRIHNLNLTISTVAAAVVSVVFVRDISRIWILPLTFVVCVAGLFLLFWIAVLLFASAADKHREYDKSSRFYLKMINIIYDSVCSVLRVRLHVSGLEKVPDGTFFIVSNHKSSIDNMCQSYVLRGHNISYISKPENFRIPFAGNMMNRCRYLPIDRDNPRKALTTIKKAIDMIKSDDMSIGLFPEGHRITDETVGKFSDGTFIISRECQRPTVISSISGSDKLKSNFPFKPTDIYIDIIDVLPFDKARSMRSNAISEYAHSLIYAKITERTENSTSE